MNLSTDIFKTQGQNCVGGVPRGAESFVLAQAFIQFERDLLYIAQSDREMDAVRLGLAFFAPGAEVVLLPAWDCLPYDRASPNVSVLASRVVALSKLSEPGDRPRILLTTVNAALQKLPPRAVMRNARYTVQSGVPLSHDSLIHFLSENGYRRAATAMEAGEFAVRGSIIDIMPSGAPGGIRLDTFGDMLESIRSFDPVSQRSAPESIAGIALTPASEVILNAATIEHFREGYRTAFGAAHGDPLYEAVSQGRAAAGMEHWLPLFYDRPETLFDYLPHAALLLDAQAEMAVAERLELTQEYYSARKSNEKARRYAEAPYHALPPDALYLTTEQWKELLESRNTMTLSPFVADNGVTLDYHPCPDFAARKLTGEVLFADLKTYVTGQRAHARGTIIACYSQGSRERIAAMLHEHGLHPLRIESFAQAKEIGGKTVGLAVLTLERGFEADGLALISEQDLFGERVIRAAPKRKKSEHFLAEAANFVPSELVVHREHGIGRFEGLITLDVNDAQHDCLKILYEGDDKLFIPVENIDLISRYGSEEEGAKLDKLGSASWQARKARLKERITMMAGELLGIAAARAVSEAVPLAAPAGHYEEFCARFPFAETEDQARAIEDVLADIASGRPTDRLVCGDVGFGKTEVAMRAAFVAASSHNERGKIQAAIVCPTTLLCRQHYRTFSERFRDLPFNLRQISRLTSPKEHKKNAGRVGGWQRGHRHRHACAAGQKHRFQEPWPAHHRRGAAFRRRAEGKTQKPQGRYPRADAFGHADPTHPATGALGLARTQHHRHAAGGQARRAHVRHAV